MLRVIPRNTFCSKEGSRQTLNRVAPRKIEMLSCRVSCRVRHHCLRQRDFTPLLPQRAVASERPAAQAATNGAHDRPLYLINEIPNNGKWERGIPPVMGGHLMASETVAPISTSQGAGLGVYPPKVAYHKTAGDKVQAILHATPEAAINTLGKAVLEASTAAIKERGAFTLVISGGSLISALPALLQLGSGSSTTLQWDKFHIFFVDERCVPHSHADSNYGQAKQALLDKVPAQVYAILEGVPVRQAAVNYESRLLALPPSVLPRNSSGLPVFDLMLLGVGPDGHVASLFPHRSHLSEESQWVVPVENSPKPPSERITMTLPVINAAKEAVFLATGDGKAEIVQRVLEVQALPGALPAQLVRLSDGRVKWLLDVQSAKNLDIAAWEDVKNFPRSM